MKVYLNEFNAAMENTVYLPIVSGNLSSYAKKSSVVNKNYEFMPFLFMKDDPDKIFSGYKQPSIAAFSVSMWNSNLCLEVARRVKERFPETLIVFGGPNVPFNAEIYFKNNPFIDVTARGEGEATFTKILERFVESSDFEGIGGISYRDKKGRYVKNEKEASLVEHLDNLPSPYLDGTFDNVIIINPKMNFQAIVETNRGCPFLCSYCFWGQGGLNKKFRFAGLERVKEIAEWIGKNKISYVSCADSNFGMFKRDLDIAQFFVDAKQKWGFPEKFRVNYGKNAEENIFQIGRLLHQNDMEKGITLSRQTNSAEAAANVNRKNIRMETYNALQKRYNETGIPTYTELILGLPGETYASFSDGLERILHSGINQVIVYHCQVYPNTELDDENYKKRFSIRISRVPLNGVHTSPSPSKSITEYEELVVSTSSMPEEEWKKSTKLAWTAQLLHGLKIGFYPLVYLKNIQGIRYTDFYEYLFQSESTGSSIFDEELNSFNESINSILTQKSYRSILPEFSPFYWEQEETSYLRIIKNKERFYDEFFRLASEFLRIKNKDFDKRTLEEVFGYQRARVPDLNLPSKTEFFFEYNIPEYFNRCFIENRALVNKPQKMVLKDVRDFKGDKKEFAVHILLRGRKSGKMLYPVEFYDVK